MDLKDMKRTPADKKAEQAKYDSPGKIGGDDYSYGTRVHLDHDMLEKLGMDTLPAVGSKVKMNTIAHVAETSEDHRDGGKKRRSMTLQIHHMGVEPHKDEGASDSENTESRNKGIRAAMDAALTKK